MKFNKLAIDKVDDLLFGISPKPLKTKQGMLLGGGTVYPELNFTLPAMTIKESTWPKVVEHYRNIIKESLERAVDLHSPGVQIECELLPPMTENPQWGGEISQILVDAMEEANAAHGLKSVLRMTPNDTREMVRPPAMRSGNLVDTMFESFELCAKTGAELLSIESVGGKEVHDEALTMADIRGVIFSLCIMGVRDMRFLWEKIVSISEKHGVYAAGDTACGFGNTAMVMADKKLIPKVFAAIVRPITAVRSLVAYECGAVGPGKDCGYENPILKAITGFPMAMEGKTAACAHLSPVGNIAAACCDVWSNESVQNIKLLGGMAPTCYLEQLEYDCRLMNQSLGDGNDSARQMQKWLVNSDAYLDPQAYVLTPENTLAFAKTIVDSSDYYQAGKNVALLAVEKIRSAYNAGELKMADREVPFMDMVQSAVEAMPDKEDDFISETMPMLDQSKFVAADYEL